MKGANMLKRKLLFMVGFVFISLFVGGTSAQEGIQVTEHNPTVAILIVDAFSPPPDPPPNQSDEENCVYSSSGQDGTVGGGLASLPPELMALLGSHGDAVFNTATQWLSTKGFGLSEVVLAPIPPVGPSQNAIARMEYWVDEFSQEILVLGVDTDNYTTAVARDNMEAVVEYYSRDAGVDDKPADEHVIKKFVINMSFAILGCSQIPSLITQDFLTAAQQMEGAEALEGLLSDVEQGLTGEQVKAQLIVSDPTYGEQYYAGVYLYLLLTKLGPETQLALQQTYDDDSISSSIDNCEQLAEAVQSNPVAGDPYLLGLFAAWQEVSIDAPEQAGNRPPGVGNQNRPCYMFEYLQPEYEEYYVEYRNRYSSRDIEVIPIAAAGNGWKPARNQPAVPVPFPYAPAIYPGVVSVSASYDPLPVGCVARGQINRDLVDADLIKILNLLLAPGNTVTNFRDAATNADPNEVPIDELLEELTFDLTLPATNSGEVRLDGVLKWPGPIKAGVPSLAGTVLGCLNGTSFSAPRLSAEAGIYLLNNGEMLCQGTRAVVRQSKPPLDHLPFDNLPRDEAANRYCGDWTNLVPVSP
jgi:hypothetical protein